MQKNFKKACIKNNGKGCEIRRCIGINVYKILLDMGGLFSRHNKSCKKIDHLATQCEKRLGRDYTRLHNLMVRCPHLLLLNRLSSVKRACGDTRIETDVKIWNNRPDIFILHKSNKKITLIEIRIISKILLQMFDLLDNELDFVSKYYLNSWHKRLQILMNIETYIQSIVFKKTLGTQPFNSVIERAKSQEEPTLSLKNASNKEDGVKHFKIKNNTPLNFRWKNHISGTDDKHKEKLDYKTKNIELENAVYMNGEKDNPETKQDNKSVEAEKQGSDVASSSSASKMSDSKNKEFPKVENVEIKTAQVEKERVEKKPTIVTLEEVNYYNENINDLKPKAGEKTSPFVIFLNSKFKEIVAKNRRIRSAKIGLAIVSIFVLGAIGLVGGYFLFKFIQNSYG
ncbi:hypothetical protein CWI38_0105p0010 [Hamiltosporidium tvaerminnensis]|uniref:Uncharacterized protein n=1 Tax=Hamiltosporidium tvaerminnensis TaxID=1176355 RepID=A0A4Q9M2L5_9MICR|nr:hypothetical protein CWI38_0105p0010 [Hamiltosporidium tvaerminnensis]